jgi:hypothetical protein
MKTKDVPLVMIVDELVGISEEAATGGIGRDAKAVLLDPTHTGCHLLRLGRARERRREKGGGGVESWVG